MISRQTLSVGDLFDLENGFAFKSKEFIDEGVPVIKIKNVKAGFFSEHEFSYVSDKFLSERGNKLAKPHDLLISMSGNRHDGSPETWVGKVAFFDRKTPYFLNQRVGALRLKNGKQADVRFLGYLLSSFPYQEQFIAIATSSGGQANLSPAQILGAEIVVPPIEEQREIAAILGALDDKIELNRNMAATLEEMARALYRSWFVDFDPVHAKAAGRVPAHMAPQTADLFPDSFGDDGLPEGWDLEALKNHVSVLRGLSYKGAGLCENDEGVPLHNLNSVFEGGGYKTAGIKYYRGDFKPRHEILPGDLIVTNTEQGFDLLLMGHSALVPHHFGPIGLFSQHIYKIEPKPGSPLSREWLYLMLSVSPKGQEIRSYSNGTTVNMLPMDALEIPEICAPSHEVIEAFDEVVKPMFARQESLEVENQTLATLRDTLLPRLMSGELRVGEAKEQVEELVG